MDRMIEDFFPHGARVLSGALPAVWEHISGCGVPYTAVPGGVLLSGSPVLTFPSVLLFAVGGAAVGLSGSVKCFSVSQRFATNAQTSKEMAYSFYSLSFLCFAVMNISAIFAHCLFPSAVYTSGLVESGSAITITPPSYWYLTVSHIAHVLDICSTGSSCVSFVVGRLFELRILSIYDYATTRPLRWIVPFIYCLGFYGLRRSHSIPFLGEFLYPGLCSPMPLVVPLLRWPKHKHKWLYMAVITFGLAFATGVFDGYLCSMVGPHWTTPAICFAMCDVLFIILAQLIDIDMLKFD